MAILDYKFKTKKNTLTLNVSHFLNLAAIFSLDDESQSIDIHLIKVTLQNMGLKEVLMNFLIELNKFNGYNIFLEVNLNLKMSLHILVF